MAYVTDKIDSLFGFFKNAKLIAQDIGITPLSQELIQEDGSTRYAVPSLQWPHREGVQVPLRIALRKHKNMPFSGNILKSIESPIYKEFPKIKAWVTYFEVTQKEKLVEFLLQRFRPINKFIVMQTVGFISQYMTATIWS